MYVVIKVKKMYLDVPTFTEGLNQEIPNTVWILITKKHPKYWYTRIYQVGQITIILEMAANYFHEDLNNRRVSTNNEERVISDTICMNSL